MACQLYFIVLTVRKRNVRNDNRLEWLVNRILLFSQSVHTTYETMTDYHQCGACLGSSQLITYYNVHLYFANSKHVQCFPLSKSCEPIDYLNPHHMPSKKSSQIENTFSLKEL